MLYYTVAKMVISIKPLKNRLYSLNVLEYGIIIAKYCKKLAYYTS